MSPVAKAPKKAAHQIKPKGAAQRINPIKALRDARHRQAQIAAQRAASTSTPPRTVSSASRVQCPNKSCPSPNVVNGTCQGCGRVVDDTDIVAEVSFGENAQGGAVVYGSYLAADQGSARPSGGLGGPRRPAGNGSGESRERVLREARQMMLGFATQLNIQEHIVGTGFQYYKLASSNNFVQGRKIPNVVSACLYAACRREAPCKVMLIDLADIVKEEVFYLGRVYKKLLQTIPIAASGAKQIFVEDLIYRFASRLEFAEDTNKVAVTAVRLVQRMDRDWMVMGRRPAGICGACIYIAKVTIATLQARLDEFKELPSAKLTVEDFLRQDFLPEEFDPPSIYKRTEEYQARLKERREGKRKHQNEEEAAEESRDGVDQAAHEADFPAAPQPRIDADGFAVPALPNNQAELPESVERELASLEETMGQAMESENMDEHLDTLADEYGDTASPDTPAVNAPTPRTSSVTPPANGEPPRKRRRPPPKGSSCRNQVPRQAPRKDPPYLTREWRDDEEALEEDVEGYMEEISQDINDPNTAIHNAYHTLAAESCNVLMDRLRRESAGKERDVVSSDEQIGEDEFADDPEVMYALLTEEEVKAKEQIWSNLNKSWLRDKQEKEWKAKLAAKGPKKSGPSRRKPRMGEGQTSPASTPGEAAVQVAESRGFSSRIDYGAIKQMLDGNRRRGPGSAITSHQTSRAGSTVGSGDNYQQGSPKAGTRRDDSAAGGMADSGDEGVENEREMYDSEDDFDEVDPFAADNDDGDLDD